MKTTFRPRLLNGQTGDPALLLSLRWQGRALLVDLGRIDRTPAPLLLPIEAVFVSHTHMDHFMGFDQLLRLLLARDATLRLYGPTGLADCVEGKLKGYTWNLTDEYAFTIDVTDIDEREMTEWRFAACRRFERELLRPPRPFTGVVLADGVFTVEAAPLDHRIVSMAYAVTERTHLNVRADALAASGLRPGRWLNTLKDAVRAGAPAAPRGAARGAAGEDPGPEDRLRGGRALLAGQRRQGHAPGGGRRRPLLRGTVPGGGSRAGDSPLSPDRGAGRRAGARRRRASPPGLPLLAAI